MYYKITYLNTVTNKHGCKLKKYKIKGTIVNNSGKTIEIKKANIKFANDICIVDGNRFFVNNQNSLSNGSFDSFTTLTNGSITTTTFNYLFHASTNVKGIEPAFNIDWK